MIGILVGMDVMSWFRAIAPEQLARIEARRICVVKPSAFGDIVQSLPVLSALRARFPQAHLAWVVKREWSELLAGHPDLDELIAIDMRAGLFRWMRLLAQLRARRFDLVFDLQGLLRSAMLTWATRAPVRVGLQTAREGANWACNCVLPGSDRLTPAHQRYQRVAQAIAADQASVRARVSWTDEDISWARQRLAGLRRPRAALHIGAAWETKRWPVEKFAALAARAVANHGAAIVLVGGQRDRQAATEFASLMRQLGYFDCATNLVGQSNLKQLAAVLADVDVLVSNDSGPMHLAAALGTPVVGIFTCTDPRRSGPPGGEHQLVSTQVACRGSYRKVCPYQGLAHHACLEEVDVVRVYQAFDRLLTRPIQVNHRDRLRVIE